MLHVRAVISSSLLLVAVASVWMGYFESDSPRNGTRPPDPPCFRRRGDRITKLL